MLIIAAFITIICAFQVIHMMDTVTKVLSSLQGKRKKRVSFGSESVKYFDEYDTPKSITVIMEIVSCIGKVKQSPTTWMRTLDWLSGVLDSSPEMMNRIRNLNEIHDNF